jgi:hypothetical protein
MSLVLFYMILPCQLTLQQRPQSHGISSAHKLLWSNIYQQRWHIFFNAETYIMNELWRAITIFSVHHLSLLDLVISGGHGEEADSLGKALLFQSLVSPECGADVKFLAL